MADNAMMLTVRDFWSQVLCCQRHPVHLLSSPIFLSRPESPTVLETLWRRCARQVLASSEASRQFCYLENADGEA